MKRHEETSILEKKSFLKSKFDQNTQREIVFEEKNNK